VSRLTPSSAGQSKQDFARRLGAIAIIGLALRVIFVLFSRVQHLPFGLGDPAFYSRGANLLAQGRGFIDPFLLPEVHEAAGHPPLYTIFLAIPSLVWPGNAATPTVQMLWTCVLGAGTIVVCGLAGREIAGARVGLIAAALAAVYPNIWVHDGMLLSETMAIFTTAMVILSAYRFLHRPSGWRVVWLGLWCGLAGLARPELVLMFPLVLVPLVLLRRAAPWSTRIKWLAAGAVATAVLLAPWVGYNLSRFERPVYMSDNFGSTLAAANCKPTYYGDEIGFKNYGCQAVILEREQRANPRWAELDESERDYAQRRAATAYIEDHADRVPVVVAARWGRILHVYEPLFEIDYDQKLFQQPIWLGYLMVFSFYLVFTFAIAGVVVMRRRRLAVWPLVAVPVIMLISVATTFAQIRYRAPAEVAFVLAAAVAVDALFTRRSRARA
jgi:4-amino-4-deoxy-L-arabinose transferase-like glycosyltransferase